MLSVRRPKAIVYGWKSPGDYFFSTDLYSRFENLQGWVDIVSLENYRNYVEDFSFHKPDIIIFFLHQEGIEFVEIAKRSFFLNSFLDDQELANFILEKSVKISCDPPKPKFSVFTPAFKTEDIILKTYSSLKEQTEKNWEWVIVDDSPEDHNKTWEMILKISKSDFRVIPQRIFPTSGGNVGFVKHRAAMLCRGEWLVELDHDDYLMPDCLEVCEKSSLNFPDAGFIYSDCTEMNEDNEFRRYDHRDDGEWYGRDDNLFAFGYAGHSWKTINGKNYLQHHHPDINPLTIRFNICMPNHVRLWKKEVYHQISGHREGLPVADDLELIIRTFLTTRMIHVKKLLYIQFFHGSSTVDHNAFDINRRARLIRDHYDFMIHNRILELGFDDWEWDEEKKSTRRDYVMVLLNKQDVKYYEGEQVLNYVYE
jgi:glycosyltransferase involved in cell wall biosynthesis